MRIAYIYARYSLKIQGSGDSLKRQIVQAEHYARKQGWQIAAPIFDLGVSAYRGRNLQNGALGEFMADIESGQVPAGSIMIIESLDRLSRDTLVEQFGLLLRIIRNGIELVTLLDGKHFTTATINANPMELIVSLAVMLRAREESDQKSMRISAAWTRKRQNASHQKLTRRCPPWLRANHDRTEFDLIGTRAESVKVIFLLAAAGWTPQMILERLTREGCEAWGKDQRWTLTKVLDVLNSRAVLGEFQPHKYVDGKRVRDGKPVANYFPAIVTPTIFTKATHALKFDKGCRQGDKNLFIGLAWDGETGEPVVKHNEYLTNESCDRGGPTHRWAYRAFEQNVLNQLEHLDWESVLAMSEGESPANEREHLEARIAEIELELERAMQEVLAGASVNTGLAMEIKTLERQRLMVCEQLEQLATKPAIQPSSNKAMRDARDAVLKMAANAHTEMRLHLRQQLRALVERIDLWPKPKCSGKMAGYYSLLEDVITAAGLAWMEQPGCWPYYKIRFVNGQERLVICQRANLLMEDTRTLQCNNNVGIIVQEQLALSRPPHPLQYPAARPLQE